MQRCALAEKSRGDVRKISGRHQLGNPGSPMHAYRLIRTSFSAFSVTGPSRAHLRGLLHPADTGRGLGFRQRANCACEMPRGQISGCGMRLRGSLSRNRGCMRCRDYSALLRSMTQLYAVSSKGREWRLLGPRSKRIPFILRY
jgi:hypothetical protein